MAKKVILKDQDNVEILPITRGELIVDSSGKEAFHSNEFLATNSQPGLMSPEEKAKISTIAGNTIDSTLSTTSVNPVQNKVVTGAINEAKQLANDAQETANDASENVSKVQQILNSIKESYLKSATVDGNVLTIVDQSDSEITFTNTTYNTFLKETAANTGGRNGLVPKPNYNDGSKTRFLREDGTWVIPTNSNTTYTFANGTSGNFTVTPSGGTAQTVSIGKPATAGTADVAVKLQTKRKLWGQDFDGTTDVSGNMTGVGDITMSGSINSVLKATTSQKAALLNVSEITANINYIHLYVSSLNDLATNTRALVLQNGYGNVGIGTTSPEYKLDVNGVIRASSHLITNAHVKILDGQALEWNDTAANGSTSNLLLPRKSYGYRLDYYDGTAWHKLAYADDIPTVTNYYWANVLISNTSNPATSPTFANVYADAARLNNYLFMNPSGEGIYLNDQGLHWHNKCTDTKSILQFTKDGLVGIGITPSYKLDVSGTFNSSNYQVGGTLELKTDDTTCQTTIFGSNSSGYRMRIVRQRTATNLNTQYSPTLVVSSLDTHAYIAWDYNGTNVWVGGGSGNKWNWRSMLLNTSNYSSYLGYIGTTAVQTSAAAQALTGITRISNSSNNVLYLGNSDNSSWVYTQDICSHSGTSKWAINVSGGAWFSKLMVGIAYSGTGSNYAVNVSGDSHVTGWSRAGNGFYVEGKGVHYMSNNANGLGQIYLTSNEFNWSASGTALYFNYRASANGTTVTSYVWNAGSSSSYASHTLGALTSRGVQTLYGRTDTCNIGNTSSGSYTEAAAQIREYNFGGSQTDTWGNAPRLTWHWSGRVAAQIGLASNGYLYTAPLTATNWYKLVYESGTWAINISGNANYATSAGTANAAYYVYDYNATTTPIYIGYSGAALSTATHFAAYGTTSSGARCIKDIAVATVKSVLGIPTVYARDIGVNGTNWTFYSSTNAATTSIYAPTSAGTSGYILQSSGGTPTWTARQDYSNPGILWVGYIYRPSRSSTSYYASKSGGKATFSLTSTPDSSYEYLSGTLSGHTSIMAAFVQTQAVFSAASTTCYAYSAINFGKGEEAGFDTYRVSVSGSTVYIRACRMTDANNSSWEDDGFLVTGSGHNDNARPVARLYLIIIGY